MIEIVDSCRTYEILLQDSGLLPKPKEDWNVFEPKEGDCAYVLEEDTYYQFNGTEWLKMQQENE